MAHEGVERNRVSVSLDYLPSVTKPTPPSSTEELAPISAMASDSQDINVGTAVADNSPVVATPVQSRVRTPAPTEEGAKDGDSVSVSTPTAAAVDGVSVANAVLSVVPEQAERSPSVASLHADVARKDTDPRAADVDQGKGKVEEEEKVVMERETTQGTQEEKSTGIQEEKGTPTQEEPSQCAHTPEEDSTNTETQHANASAPPAAPPTPAEHATAPRSPAMPTAQPSSDATWYQGHEGYVNSNQSIFGSQGKYDVSRNEKTAIKVQMTPDAIIIAKKGKVVKTIPYIQLKKLEHYREEVLFFGPNVYLALLTKDDGVYVICSEHAPKIKEEIQRGYKLVKEQQH